MQCPHASFAARHKGRPYDKKCQKQFQKKHNLKLFQNEAESLPIKLSASQYAEVSAS